MHSTKKRSPNNTPVKKCIVTIPDTNISKNIIKTLNTYNLRATACKKSELTLLSPDKNNKKRYMYNDDIYLEFCTTSVGNIFIEASPEQVGSNKKAKCELKANNTSNIESPNPKKFSFFVTKSGIFERSGVKRTISQKQVMRHSAEEELINSGASLESIARGYCWAHCQAWMFGGEQSAENLIPTTTASNINTLHLVEIPIKNALLQNVTDKINVDGEVQFHPDNMTIPIKITYTLSWGNTRTAQFEIFPLDHRKSKTAEHIISRTALSFLRTPEKKKDNSSNDRLAYNNTCDTPNLQLTL